MRKIPTLFVRDENDRRYVTEEVTPGGEWVLAGEGQATRKYDGTCVRLDGAGKWWARREVKPGKPMPPVYEVVDHDDVTGKTVGWEPIEESPFRKMHAEAMRYVPAMSVTGDAPTVIYAPGTYELCGPKINGNPEKFEVHRLIRHADAEMFGSAGRPRSPEWIRSLIPALAERGWEGVVWHHPDGRMVKLKARDLPRG